MVILGGGESGMGAAMLAGQHGYEVFVSDGGSLQPKYQEELEQRGIAYEQGGHSEDRILNADEIIKSPGIPEKNELVKNFHRFNNLKHATVKPKAFTEKGLYMLATILKSDIATQTTLAIIETYSRIKNLSKNIKKISDEHDEQK